jgi:hypothetical protein
MGVEVIGHDVELRGLGLCLHQRVDQIDKVLFVSGVADLADDLSGGDIEARQQALGAMPLVFELDGLRFALFHRSIRSDPFLGLDAGHLIDADGDLALLLGGDGLGVERADILSFLFLLWIGFGIEPVARAMRLELGFSQQTPEVSEGDGGDLLALVQFVFEFTGCPVGDRAAGQFGLFTGQGHYLALMFGGELGWSPWARGVLQTLSDRGVRRGVAPATDPFGNGIDDDSQASGDSVEWIAVGRLEDDFGA